MKQDIEASSRRSLKRDLSLTLGALGVVFGDIGTSPLYAMRESARAAGSALPGALGVYGALSLIFWALIIVVTLKYVFLIMRADNNGEGGVMALAALAHRAPVSRPAKTAIGVAALLGLALFYGDGMLTPVITVLSAVEGIAVDNAGFKPFILPLSLVLLVALFAVQRRGTGKIGKYFGPFMLLWFVVLAVLGAAAIARSPQILLAVNPLYGIRLFLVEPWTAFVALGSVVLAVTGCEALYADMGHFGARPIRWAWL
jgi:KUP system potassium uptake protein